MTGRGAQQSPHGDNCRDESINGELGDDAILGKTAIMLALAPLEGLESASQILRLRQNSGLVFVAGRHGGHSIQVILHCRLAT